MARPLRRAALTAALPALVAVSTVAHWLLGRRVSGLWILPDEAVYAERALALWRHGSLPLLHGEGAGYGVLYPAVAGLPLAVGSLPTGYASLKLLQALVVSLVAVPLFFYGRRVMRPGYALAAGVLAVVSPLTLYSGFVMTEVLIYPLGAFALLAIARAVETATPRDQAVAFGAIALCVLTRVQSIVLLLVFALAVLAARAPLRSFVALWVVLAAAVLVAAAAPGAFGAYAGTLNSSYPVGSSLRLSVEHLAYLALSTGVVPVAALALFLARPPEGAGARAIVVTAGVAVVCVVAQVGLFSARFAPHLLGRDLALLPPVLFLVLCLWLDRDAPRPRSVVAPVTLLALALLLLTPWAHLVSIEALPDTFGISWLYDAGTDDASLLVAAVAVVALALFALAPRGLTLVVPVAIAGALIAATAIASRDTTRRVAFDQTELVGQPRDWIDRGAGRTPATVVYDGETYWNGVWQMRFWNSSVRDVVSLSPSQVPGPLPQRVVAVPPSGRLPLTTPLVAASDALHFDGVVVSHVDQPETDVGGSTLWRLSSPPRLSTITTGIHPNGDITPSAVVRAYDCGGGRLELTLLPKATQVVTLSLDGHVVQRERIAGLPFWNGTIDVPPSAHPRSCVFEIAGQGLLGSTRVEFVGR